MAYQRMQFIKHCLASVGDASQDSRLASALFRQLGSMGMKSALLYLTTHGGDSAYIKYEFGDGAIRHSAAGPGEMHGWFTGEAAGPSMSSGVASVRLEYPANTKHASSFGGLVAAFDGSVDQVLLKKMLAQVAQDFSLALSVRARAIRNGRAQVAMTAIERCIKCFLRNLEDAKLQLSEKAIMQAMTDALVEAIPRLALADVSIRYNEHDIVPIAQSGPLQGFGLTASLNDPDSEHSLTQRAVVEKRPAVVVGGRNDPFFAKMLASIKSRSITKNHKLVSKKGKADIIDLARSVQLWVAVPMMVKQRCRGAVAVACLDADLLSGQLAKVLAAAASMACAAAAAAPRAYPPAVPETAADRGGARVGARVAMALQRFLAARMTIHNIANVAMHLDHQMESLLKLVRDDGKRISAQRELDRIWARLESAIKLYQATGDTLTKVDISLDYLVRNIADFLGPHLEERSIRLTVVGETDPFSFKCNEGEMLMCLLNLIGNAIDSFDSRGEVALAKRSRKSKSITLRLGMMAIGAYIKIEDNGCGIRPDDMTNVFREGFTTKAARGGTGLGLSHAKALIDGLGGSIKLESALGKGTTVTIRIGGRPAVTNKLDRDGAPSYPYH